MSKKDLLLLLEPGFVDPVHPGERFVCRHCLPIEGLLAGEPARAAQLEVRRLAFPRPRPEVIALLDEAHQSLPVLILGDEHPLPEDANTLGETRFINDVPRILALLAERYGFSKVH